MPGPLGRRERDRRVAVLTGNPPPLPNFSHFPDRFQHDLGNPDGDLRATYFLAYVPEACEYLPPEELAARVSQGREVLAPQRRSHGGLTGVVRTGGSP